MQRTIAPERSQRSPFHAGEQRIQEALGVREQIEPFARRMVRSFLPDQHIEFYHQLPFLVATARDARGRPWVTVLANEPGFVSAPNDRQLDIAALPAPTDALAGALTPGSDVGILGIELHTRRRNRVNGRVVHTAGHGLSLEVDQTFGNCPQHIHVRQWERDDARRPAPRSKRTNALELRQRAWIEAADTFFIGTGHPDVQGAGRHSEDAHGMDASHRGGPAGFVEVDGDRTLTFPDYAGNNHFNTLGNLLLDPRAGITFVDFEQGSLLQLTGRAEIDWRAPDAGRAPGAQRLVRFLIDEVVEQRRVLPIRWRSHEHLFRPLRLVERVRDSRDAVSFYFESATGDVLEPFVPGQHLPIEVRLDANGATAQRTYSLSNAPGGSHYRITVKREPEGLVSRWLHDKLQPGSIVGASTPAGTFRLDLEGIAPDTPLLLVGAGIGITPLASMLHSIRLRRPDQRVHLIHGVRNAAHHPLARELRRAVAGLPNATIHTRYSRPFAGDVDFAPGQSVGRVDCALLESIAPVTRSRIYLCGPAAFTAQIEGELIARGVDGSAIEYETF